MSSSVGPACVSFDEDGMWLELADGNTLGVPSAWFPRPLRAASEQRAACRISNRGPHWTDLDGDISVAGPLAGRGHATPRPVPATA